MTLLDFAILLIVAAVCGAIGQVLAGYSVGGCITSILVGLWIAGAQGLPEIFAIKIAGRSFPIVWSVIGSVLFVAVLALLTRGRVTI